MRETFFFRYITMQKTLLTSAFCFFLSTAAFAATFTVEGVSARASGGYHAAHYLAPSSSAVRENARKAVIAGANQACEAKGGKLKSHSRPSVDEIQNPTYDIYVATIDSITCETVTASSAETITATYLYADTFANGFLLWPTRDIYKSHPDTAFVRFVEYSDGSWGCNLELSNRPNDPDFEAHGEICLKLGRQIDHMRRYSNCTTTTQFSGKSIVSSISQRCDGL